MLTISPPCLLSLHILLSVGLLFSLFLPQDTVNALSDFLCFFHFLFQCKIPLIEFFPLGGQLGIFFFPCSGLWSCRSSRLRDNLSPLWIRFARLRSADSFPYTWNKCRLAVSAFSEYLTAVQRVSVFFEYAIWHRMHPVRAHPKLAREFHSLWTLGWLSEKWNYETSAGSFFVWFSDSLWNLPTALYLGDAKFFSIFNNSWY